MRMPMRGVSKLGLLFLFLVLVGIVHLSCNPALPLAPPGSSITLIPNPCGIPASGGVAVIAAVVITATGVPVADGTVVQFFTDLGQIDREGKTNDGVARVNLVSDGRSGSATITAFSGGGSSSSSGSSGTTPTAAPTAATAVPASGTGNSTRIARIEAGDVRSMAGTASGSCTGSAVTGGTATATVVIGGSRVGSIILSASPVGISPGGTSLLTATVIDDAGNPVANVGVVFVLTGPGRLSSGGRAVFTDNNGQAQDVVQASDSATVDLTVTAEIGSTSSNQATIKIITP
jgi:hypothetical protein